MPSEGEKINKILNEKTLFVGWLVSIIVSVLVPYFTLKQDIALESQQSKIAQQANAEKWDSHEKDFSVIINKIDKINNNVTVLCTLSGKPNCEK